jgi:two-component system, NarL family, nitrate/nitrite response regulator NarL
MTSRSLRAVCNRLPPPNALLCPPMARVGVHPVELTPREREILLLAADGRSAPDIAGHLRVSSAVVNTTLLSSFEKLGVYDRKGAVAAALESGLLE